MKYTYTKPRKGYYFAGLKVTELGKQNTAFLNNTKNWWFNDTSFNHLIETSMGLSGDLVVKLLPGQSKILKVEVIEEQDAPKGNLAYNGQTKIVGYKAYNTVDSIRYHLVYFRKDNASNKNKVYYRRSYPTNTALTNILWEPEILISQNSELNGTNYPIDSMSCDFPSVVVNPNPDDSGNEKIYVVYSCNDSNRNCIVETILPADSANQRILSTKILSDFKGLDHYEWGNPVVSSANYNNFYAWSDSLKGIAISSKNLDALQLDSIKYIFYDSLGIKNGSKHPSISTFSTNQTFGTEMPGLCWQEKYFNDRNMIVYTKIWAGTDGTINDYFPKIKDFFYSRRSIIYNADSTVACVSLCEGNNTFPSITRLDNCYSFPFVDEISWEKSTGNPGEPSFTSQIMLSSIGFLSYGEQFGEEGYYASHFSIINAEGEYLYFPNITYGVAYHNSLSFKETFLLQFEGSRDVAWVYNTPSGNNKLYQFRFPKPSIFSNYYYTYQQYPMTDKFIDLFEGRFPHYAVLNNLAKDELSSWKNNRVLNDYTDYSNPYIRTERRGLRTSADFQLTPMSFIGFMKDSNSVLINFPTLNNSTLSFILPHKFINDTVAIPIKSDTLFSTWFSASEPQYLKFLTKGDSMNFVSAKIQRQSDSICFALPLSQMISDTICLLNNFLLINGGDDLYRFMLVNLDSTAIYTEEVYLDSLPVVNPVAARVSSEDISVVNLGKSKEYKASTTNNIELSVYPNPPKDVMFITAQLPLSASDGESKNIHIKVLSVLGLEIFSSYIQAGETLQFDTKLLGEGFYFIRAENADALDKTIAPAMQKIVIER